jgi:hypothetical protein
MNHSMLRTVLIVLCCAAVATAAPAGDGGLNVGDFLYRVAQARNLPAVDGADALRLLKDAGVPLPTLALTEPLTEESVVQILRSLGILVTTSQPEAPVGSGSMDAILDLIMSSPDADQATTSSNEPGPYPRPNDQAADPADQGRGKKKGLPPVSESDPN